jgi:SAM-dependent methyltransferase
MSHSQQMFFISNLATHLAPYFNGKKVLEVGSLNINGSVRQFFKGCDYLGLDIAEGKEVDLVCKGEDFGAPANYFDTVISSEMFEHNMNYVKCWMNMIRMMKEDGLLLFTCATTGRRQHGTTKFNPEFSPLSSATGNDYYKNLVESDFSSVISMDTFFSVWAFFDDFTFRDIYFMGVGKSATEETKSKALGLVNSFKDFYYKRNILGEY